MTYSAQKLHACIGAAFYSSMGAAVVTCNAGLDARIIHQVGVLLTSPYGHTAVQSSDFGFGICCGALPTTPVDTKIIRRDRLMF